MNKIIFINLLLLFLSNCGMKYVYVPKMTCIDFHHSNYYIYDILSVSPLDLQYP